METILTSICLWFVGVFWVATILMIHFTTQFTQYVFVGLKKLGWKRKDKEFFVYTAELEGGFEYEESVGNLTPDDWEQWLRDHFHPKFAELLTCQVCFATQTSIWTGLIVAIVSGHFWLWLIAAVSWPSAGKILFKKI